MKFAKELEEDLVPEWRVKYFNYKQGKKKVKAVARALRNVNNSPKTPGKWKGLDVEDYVSTQMPPSFSNYHFPSQNDDDNRANPYPRFERQTSISFMSTPPIPIPEREPLTGSNTNYGSIAAATPSELPGLELPGPALNTDGNHRVAFADGSPSLERNSDPYHIGNTRKPFSSLPRKVFPPPRAASTPGPVPKPALLRRMFSSSGLDSQPTSSGDFNLLPYRELETKQHEFFQFLDSELAKIEDFYKMKELEASERLKHIREQLHEMRDRRVAELNAVRESKSKSQESKKAPGGNGVLTATGVTRALQGVGLKPHFGKTTKAMSNLGSPSKPAAIDADNRDYTRRHQSDNVPYRVAKRKLKLAMQEYYRGLELLKSYALLNRTAFRKINKKYDKAVNARPTGRYMSEKVNKAYFVQSDVIEGYIVAVEDLYARYFERGNHKIAVGKLRTRNPRTGAFSSSTFRNGSFLAAGAVFAIEGLVNSANYLQDSDPTVRTQTSYLLQIYGGYFLALLLFMIFILDCRVWSRSRINYVFIFEFDTRHVLDWRQLAELPCFFAFLEGILVWLNFRTDAVDSMFIYWPVVLIGLTMVTLLFPGPVLYRHSRQWWAYSNWRLLLAGLYPVEFRDFFLGDMYCSQTYAMGNIELFFCLYANHWNNPPQCNSSHSRLLGFFSALPAIWRALQCIRRYYDSKNWFPHLVNCGKYSFNILFYVSLSLWRINKVPELRELFIFFGVVNSLYSSVWDLAMDWSLLNPYAQYPFLRNNLGYRNIWIYYAAMVIDPLLRFNWIFYAIFSNEIQHSALLSFFVGLSEVFRRGMWTLFRVENEHCTNVGRFRASRDIPLPYSLPESPSSSVEHSPDLTGHQSTPSQRSTGVDIENAPSTITPSGSSLRIRKGRTPPQPLAQTPTMRGLQRVGTIISLAHAQDFEKKKRPGVVGDSPESEALTRNQQLSSDDDDDDDDESIQHDHSDDYTDQDDEPDVSDPPRRRVDGAKAKAYGSPENTRSSDE